MSEYLRKSILGRRSGSGYPIVHLLYPALLVLGAYGIVRGEQVFKTYLNLTVELGTSEAGVWLFLEVFVSQAPSLTIVLLGLAGYNAYRNGGLLGSCLLPTAVMTGMSLGVYGIPPMLTNVVEPAIPGGVILGIVGWMLGIGVKHLRDWQFQDV